MSDFVVVTKSGGGTQTATAFEDATLAVRAYRDAKAEGRSAAIVARRGDDEDRIIGARGMDTGEALRMLYMTKVQRASGDGIVHRRLPFVARALR